MPSRPLVTRIGVLSYPTLDRPKKLDQNQPAKYSCALILEPSKLDTLREAILAVATEEFGANALEMLKTGALRSPIRSGDEPKTAKDPNYAGKFFINCYRDEAQGPPQLLKWIGPGQDPVPLTDKAELYAGCFVQLNLGVFAYKSQMNKGIGTALNGVLLVSAGKRIGGGVDNTTAFKQAGVDEAEAAALRAKAQAEAEQPAASGGGSGASPW